GRGQGAPPGPAGDPERRRGRRGPGALPPTRPTCFATLRWIRTLALSRTGPRKHAGRVPDPPLRAGRLPDTGESFNTPDICVPVLSPVSRDFLMIRRLDVQRRNVLSL